MQEFEILFEKYRQYAVEDSLFASGYENTGPYFRSWLKKCATQVFELMGHSFAVRQKKEISWQSGLHSCLVQTPLNWVMVCLGRDFCSPVQLCSLLSSISAAKVSNLILVREPGELPLELLTACELVGWENVFELDKNVLQQFVFECLDHSRHGKILFLGQNSFSGIDTRCESLIFKLPALYAQALIYIEKETDWDLDVLSWAQPNFNFTAYGLEPELQSSLKFKYTDSIESIHGYDVMYAPVKYLEKYKPLIGLAPGQEGCWFWPQLDNNFFTYKSIYLS